MPRQPGSYGTPWGTGWGEIAGYGSERGYMYVGYNAAAIGTLASWVRAPNSTYQTSPRIPAILSALPAAVAPPPVQTQQQVAPAQPAQQSVH